MRKQVATLLAGLVVATIAKAVTVSTDPVGFITLTIKGTATSDGLTAVSVPMLSASLHSGVIYEVNGATITDSNASWADGDFATPDANGNPSHYIEITNHTDATKVGLIFEITASDGELRIFESGSVRLLEDTTGGGHRSRVIGAEDVLNVAIQLD